MMDGSPGAIYRSRSDDFRTALKRQNRMLGYIGILRLVLIVLVFYFIILAVRNDVPMLFLLSGLFTVMFFIFVSYHKNQADRRNLIKELLLLNESELECLAHRYTHNDPGSAFIDANHPWSFDLDIFGEGSLFQYISRSKTPGGKQKLASLLQEFPGDADQVMKRQDVNRELSEKIDFRQLFTAHASLMDTGRENTEALLRWAKEKIYIRKQRWLFFAALLMSGISITVIILSILNSANWNYILLILLVNWSLLAPFIARTNREQAHVSKKHDFLKTYSVLLQLIQNESFENTRMNEIRRITSDGSRAIRRLSALLNIFDHRLNLVIGVAFNSLFLFDFIVLHFIGIWKEKYGDQLAGWISAVSETEACVSLAGFSFNHPGAVYPRLDIGSNALKAADLGHPLIPDAKRVDNSIETEDHKVVFITGANMAGKSTFLRSVGISFVLMYAGCPVIAKAFHADFFRLFSSMRTSDSLKDEESYFLAEIKRLKLIVDRMQQGEKMLILLDEVLKGTNTTDKKRGSRGLIEKALGHDILCFIATHDLSLGEMEQEHPKKVVNYCFESYIGESDVSFDYKIRKGIARNMNASFLMKKMGIMDD